MSRSILKAADRYMRRVNIYPSPKGYAVRDALRAVEAVAA